jgi:hypothetical protein
VLLPDRTTISQGSLKVTVEMDFRPGSHHILNQQLAVSHPVLKDWSKSLPDITITDMVGWDSGGKS